MPPQRREARPRRLASVEPVAPPRVIVERVQPQINDGRFPVKRTPGEWMPVTAHVHADGHDVLAVILRYRRSDTQGALPWAESPMEALGNDEWGGGFRVDCVGRYQYCVVARIDPFETWRRDLGARVRAGQDVSAELIVGAALVAAAADRAEGEDAAHLRREAGVLASAETSSLRVEVALDARLQRLMARHPDRRGDVTYERALELVVERERARFGAWYEMFPRSWGPDASRGATFAEAESHLPRVAAMGFDVVYLPPIHPIGESHRKGRGNALIAGPGDPGSPWAIGSAAGGHTAVHPGLGTLADFEHFVAVAAAFDLEVALDIAFQCSPDHPWVREHPEWFRHRPDGTIRYAENPPKKYQDIYPLDFESSDWRGLWDALRDVVLFWARRGVRIFRVDNPHTKPYAFWEWLIAEVRREFDDAIFLSEAFTRPKVMYYLAKLGFTQSYTYFTWRNTAPDLRAYFTELTATEVQEYFRPNLFANTPDILHAYLQEGGPPAFAVRLLLAATLGASYGIYSGFELCEGRAVPGTEEYLDSEKYQVRQWDWERPGNIKALVGTINRARRENIALQFDGTLHFHDCDNPHLLCYSKTAPDGSNGVLVVVNLDPAQMQHGHVDVPLAKIYGAAPRYPLVDILTGVSFEWTDGRNYVRLDPTQMPGHLLKLGAN